MHDTRQGGALDVVIPSDPAEARRVQDAIETALKSNRFEDREIFSINLSLDEALVNAIKHGNRLDRDKKVRVQFQVQTDRFEIHIADEGPGFDPEQVPDPKTDENLTRPGGRGLLLMRHYMTEVVVHPPGNQLSMMKVHRNGHAVPARATEI